MKDRGPWARAWRALLVMLIARPAAAFCPTRTCLPAFESCEVRGADCVVAGESLFRPTSCVSFNVQADGSARHGLAAGEFERVVSDAFARWTSADCGGGSHPSISAQSLGAAECHRVQCNCTQGNANIFMFDDAWTVPGPVNAYALTTVFFSRKSGEIVDVDVEINGSVEDLRWGPSAEGIDLPSIVTHEVGHFLGLGHSPDDPTAVMRLTYRAGEDLRTLTDDDRSGICGIYPPGRPAIGECTPRNGFAADCGPGDCDNCSFEPESGGCCSTAPGRSGGQAALGAASALLLAAAGRRAGRRGTIKRQP